MVRFSFLLMLSILTLVSCGDDDSSDVNSSDIQGTWKIESSATGSEIAVSGFLSRSELDYVSGDIEIEFKDDGTYEQVGSGVYSLTSILDGETYDLGDQTIALGQTGTYTAVNGRLEGFAVTSTDPNSPPPANTDDAVYTYSINGDQLTIDLTGTVETTSQGQTYTTDVFGTVVYNRQ